MKKILSLTLLVVILSLSLASCFGSGEFTVTFVYGDGRENTTQSVIAFTAATRPSDPARENYIFNGWYTDKECKNAYSFTESITASITLYADWIPDYEKLSSAVSAYVIDSCVTLKVTHFKKIGHMLSAAASSVGSGVIFKDSGGYYYALTNSHVVELEEGCSEREYTVTDAFGREYGAQLVYDDPLRDLACVRFSSLGLELGALDFSESAANEGDLVIAIGSPLGKPNVTTFGTYLHFRAIEVAADGANETQVTFPVIWHSAYVNHGSSGGVLLSAELKIVGINFATSTDKNGDFAYGFAIPLDEVLAFVGEITY